METNVYLLVALVSSGIFLLQFILSIFFGSVDVDVDVNADGSAEFDMGSILSFKGLIHFAMGAGWFMYLFRPPYSALHYIGAIVSGALFVFILAWLYKLCFKLRQVNKPEEGTDLVGRQCTIYARCGKGETEYVVNIAINGAQRQLTVKSANGRAYKEGATLILKDYKGGTYFID